MNHKERLDYHRELSAQFPLAPIRIVYTASGANLAAAIVQNEEAIIEHNLYWAATDSLLEAHYLCGLLNCQTLCGRVSKFQSQGQWGARHFDKYVFRLPIPRFDEGIELHRNIAAASEVAMQIAAEVPEISGEHFTRTRHRIRIALADHGVAKELERLVLEFFD